MKIAIISGKGGSGKSSVSAAFVRLAPRVVAVDCDVDASNLPLLFPHRELTHEKFVSGTKLTIDRDRCIGCGQCISHCAFGALRLEEGRLEMNEFFCEGCNLCVRLCRHHALKLEEVAASDIYTSDFAGGLLVHGNLRPGDDNSGKMIARLRRLADEGMERENIPLQILDGPPGIGCPVLSTVTGVDRVVLVGEPSLSGISDLQRAYRITQSFCHDIMVVINKADLNTENCEAIRQFCREHSLPIIAELPFDREMVNAQLNCQDIISYAPQSDCTLRLKAAFDRITEPIPAPGHETLSVS